MANRNQNTLSRAYFSAQHSKAQQKAAERAEVAPKIYQVLKSGKLSKNPLNQTYHRWNTMDEAERVARDMEDMNPGQTYVVIDPTTGASTTTLPDTGQPRLTYRERRENRVDRRRGWAESRDRKAVGAFEEASLSEDKTGIPFGQPILVGHHSESRHRKTIERATKKGFEGLEHSKMRDKHLQAANTIEHQLATSIYSDDPDVVERLTEKITGLEVQRERVKRINKQMRKSGGSQEGLDLTNKEKLDIASAKLTGHDPTKGYPSYHLSGLSGRIKQAKDRLKRLEGTTSGPSPRSQAGQLLAYEEQQVMANPTTTTEEYKGYTITTRQNPQREGSDVILVDVKDKQGKTVSNVSAREDKRAAKHNVEALTKEMKEVVDARVDRAYVSYILKDKHLDLSTHQYTPEDSKRVESLYDAKVDAYEKRQQGSMSNDEYQGAVKLISNQIYDIAKAHERQNTGSTPSHNTGKPAEESIAAKKVSEASKVSEDSKIGKLTFRVNTIQTVKHTPNGIITTIRYRDDNSIAQHKVYFDKDDIDVNIVFPVANTKAAPNEKELDVAMQAQERQIKNRNGLNKRLGEGSLSKKDYDIFYTNYTKHIGELSVWIKHLQDPQKARFLYGIGASKRPVQALPHTVEDEQSLAWKERTVKNSSTQKEGWPGREVSIDRVLYTVYSPPGLPGRYAITLRPDDIEHQGSVGPGMQINEFEAGSLAEAVKIAEAKLKDGAIIKNHISPKPIYLTPSPSEAVPEKDSKPLKSYDSEVDVMEAAKQTGYSEYRTKLMAKAGKLVGAHKVGKKWMIPTPVMIRANDGKEVEWKKGGARTDGPAPKTFTKPVSASPKDQGLTLVQAGQVQLHTERYTATPRYALAWDLLDNGEIVGKMEPAGGDYGWSVWGVGKLSTLPQHYASNRKEAVETLKKHLGKSDDKVHVQRKGVVSNLKPPVSEGSRKTPMGPPPLTQESLNKGRR